ncbi:MAG TPA: hypothetical protein ENH48_06165 [Halieaceae bacterium]|nr:hypothetical protein [Halieaceae bacterium]
MTICNNQSRWTRIKEGIGRAFFCTVKGQEIMILHPFVKKTQRKVRAAHML